jgi:hypothetical protein
VLQLVGQEWDNALHHRQFLQVNKFKARFAGSALGNVATLSDSTKGEKEKK